MTLSEITTTFRGEYITKKDSIEGSIPVILGGQEPAYYVEKGNHSGEVVVVSRSGVSAGFVSYWNEDIFITDGFGFETNPDKMLPRFLYYYLKNQEHSLNALKRGAGVPHINAQSLNNLLIPVPSIVEQEEVVCVLILDNFTSLEAELEAELEARRKQYEYYRDKLLTFQEKRK